MTPFLNVTEFVVGNDEIKNGLIVPIKIYDDLNNSVCIGGAYSNVNILSNYTASSVTLQKVDGILKDLEKMNMDEKEKEKLKNKITSLISSI